MILAERHRLDTARSAGRQSPVFERILCNVDGSEADGEAVRQAAVLAASNGALTLIALATGGLSLLATRPETRIKRLGDALERARRIASQHGATAAVEFGAGDGTPVEQLMRRSRGHGLLVVGGYEHSRPIGIARGRTASAVLHDATVPVLLARTPPQGTRFPDRIVVATDGSAAAPQALDLGLALCEEHHAKIALVLATRSRDFEPETLTSLNRELFEEIAVDRLVIDPHTAPHAAIVEWAKIARASLIVIGSRGLTSARVAQHAPCSVLVVSPSTKRDPESIAATQA